MKIDNYGDLVKELLTRSGKSQREFARLCGLNQTSVGKYIRLSCPPNSRILDAMLKIAGLPWAWLDKSFQEKTIDN